MKLKNLTLKNFKGIEKLFISFENTQIALLYGPNGIGKSSLLEAVNIVGNPLIFEGRGRSSVRQYIRSLILSDDYQPAADHVLQCSKQSMRVDATFTDATSSLGGGIWTNSLSNDGISGDLPSVHGGHVFYVDADNQSNVAKFQLTDVEAHNFVELAEAIYGYPIDLDGEVWDERTGDDGVKVRHLFYNDLILNKGKRKVHYPQMSAGEKKIATMIRQIINPDNTANRDILLIDNIEIHVYFKRHVPMLRKLIEMFPDKQIIATTHSSEMINFSCDGLRKYDISELVKPPVVTDLYEEPVTREGPPTIVDFFQTVKEKAKRKFPSHYPDWVEATHDPKTAGSSAIIIDLDEDRVYDPIPNQYTPGMLRPAGRRQPPPRPEGERSKVRVQNAQVDFTSVTVAPCVCCNEGAVSATSGVADVTLTTDVEPNYSRNTSDVSPLMELTVQVNGKDRGKFMIPSDADDATILAAAEAAVVLKSPVAMRKYVPNKLVNIVTKYAVAEESTTKRSIFRPIDDLKVYVRKLSRKQT